MQKIRVTSAQGLLVVPGVLIRVDRDFVRRIADRVEDPSAKTLLVTRPFQLKKGMVVEVKDPSVFGKAAAGRYEAATAKDAAAQKVASKAAADKAAAEKKAAEEQAARVRAADDRGGDGSGGAGKGDGPEPADPSAPPTSGGAAE